MQGDYGISNQKIFEKSIYTLERGINIHRLKLLLPQIHDSKPGGNGKSPRFSLAHRETDIQKVALRCNLTKNNLLGTAITTTELNLNCSNN